MDIHIGTYPFGYYAIDYDIYDGAPDSGPRAHEIGYGKTPQEAIADLKERLAEYEP